MSRLADYFVVVGYDYDKECMYFALDDRDVVQGIISGAKIMYRSVTNSVSSTFKACGSCDLYVVMHIHSKMFI